MENYKVFVVLSLLFCLIPTFNALDTLTPGQSISVNESLISISGIYELGFFSFGSSDSKYFGIWFKNISPITPVWVANRDSPIGNSSGIFNVTERGNLVVRDGTGATVWSSTSSASAENPVVQILDSGNLVVKDGGNIIWQSFDHPGDTLLPGMKLLSNMVTSQNTTALVCWRDTEDPSQGDYLLHIDTHGLPQLFTSKGDTIASRLGPWNGLRFAGIPGVRTYEFLSFKFVINDQEVYYEYDLLNSSIATRYVINPTGHMQRFAWSDSSQSWDLLAYGPVDECENYATCGPNSNCNVNESPICVCLDGFEPKSPVQWESNNWTDGCIRKDNFNCSNKDSFQKYTIMKVPDTYYSWYDMNLSLSGCQEKCLENCSCTACANLDITGAGSGCILWFGDIIDLRRLTSGGQDFYVRMPPSNQGNAGNKKKMFIGIITGLAGIVAMIIVGVAIFVKRKKQNKPAINLVSGRTNIKNEKEEDIGLPKIDLSTIADATNNFSNDNKLGEGGFGPVYKGVLANGQEIAVKRLSKKSDQGPEEFINEIELIAKLQHRNLVKLLGCCLQDNERLLIYEFMPNRSLDYFIFDKSRSSLLEWKKRFQIIGGIARGLLYLHQDSRVRIIHRDLKASNILLDYNMNPKISDFGLAKTFWGDEEEGNTKRVVGTYGYMPPEYAVYGSFSVKSDVFSFGVIILEIVTGKKNREFFDSKYHINLLGHAWRLWCEDKPLELMDECLRDSAVPAEVLRSIHIGLLCVQERSDDRPDMSSVVLMLNGDKALPKPKQPAFYSYQQGSSSSQYELLSANELSITVLDAR